MRCSSYCIASGFDSDNLIKNLVEKGNEPKYFDDVIHIQKDMASARIIDIFIFSFGSIIFWASNENDEKLFIDECKKFTLEPLENYSFDFIDFKIDEKAEKTFIDEEQNMIILHDHSDFIKLSISHALAQSVKLNVLEESVSALIKKTAPIQQEMAATGSVSLSKNEISKKIGLLFSERYSINLHSDILDTPEFFWRRPSYEPLYLMTAAFQDIQVRQDILNRRLDMIHELYSILSNELNYKHSTRLEIIIIVLIAIEVLLAFSHFISI